MHTFLTLLRMESNNVIENLGSAFLYILLISMGVAFTVVLRMCAKRYQT